MLSSEWTVLPQPYDLLSFCGVYRGHLLTSCCSAIAERRSVFQFRSWSPAFCRGGGENLMIHPIKYLFTGHEPTSAMRVSEAWEWPQPAHTHTHTHKHTQTHTHTHTHTGANSKASLTRILCFCTMWCSTLSLSDLWQPVACFITLYNHDTA